MTSFHWLRPKELQQQYHESQRLFAKLTPDQTKVAAEKVVQELYTMNSNALVHLQDHVVADAQILPWLTENTKGCQGTPHWLSQQLRHPIHDPELLQQRQKALQQTQLAPGELIPLTETEPDVLWALQLPPIAKAWPAPLLFPQWFALRWMNKSSALLEIYHLYRIYGATLSHLIYPLTLFLGPWWYIRTKLKWKLPFQTYCSFLKKGLVELLKNRTGNIREHIVKIVTIAVYLGVYLYGVFQSLDIAYMLYHVRSQLKQRLKNIHRFISQTETLWYQRVTSKTFGAIWGFPSLDAETEPSMLSKQIGGVYQLFQNSAQHSGYLKTVLMKAYVLQGIARLQAFVKPDSAGSGGDRWAMVRWLKPHPERPSTPRLTMTGMGHPMLGAEQRRNPISLSKNLILTGPNAAGKSTYVRSLLTNVLLAQTFGICFAQKIAMTPIHTIASFMRVYDVVGSQSLFEAECRRSLELLRQVGDSPQPAPTLLFLDEPMHATPPTEGAATAMALVHYLAKYSHVRLMITTHYHLLAELERRWPEGFRNISMEATTNPISFSYRLQAGPSFQSIALEMLEKDAFPDALLKDAIEIKNKICMFENNE